MGKQMDIDGETMERLLEAAHGGAVIALRQGKLPEARPMGVRPTQAMTLGDLMIVCHQLKIEGASLDMPVLIEDPVRSLRPWEARAVTHDQGRILIDCWSA